MIYQPAREVFPSAVDNLQEKMFRLRQQIVEAQQYRRKLEGEAAARGEGSSPGLVNGLGASQRRVEKQIADLRIWEMEARLTALLDSYGD